MKETDPGTPPRVATWLGYLGLIPFLALAVLTGIDPERRPIWHATLRAYGAVILSFVGALHWGVAMVDRTIATPQRSKMLVWSVVPCLIGFGALLATSVLGEALLVSGFLAHYWQDRRLAATIALPAWYMPLRLRLSAVAILCLVAGAVVTGTQHT